MKSQIQSIALTMLAVLPAPFSMLGQSAGSQKGTVTESFVLTKTPDWLGSRMGVGTAVAIRREGVLSICVLDDAPAYKYLKENQGQLIVKDAYSGGQNSLSMPFMVLHASAASPLNVEQSGLLKYMGGDLVSELTNAGKLRQNAIVEDLEFYAVRFIQQGEDFVVSGWMPAFLTTKFDSSK